MRTIMVAATFSGFTFLFIFGFFYFLFKTKLERKRNKKESRKKGAGRALRANRPGARDQRAPAPRAVASKTAVQVTKAVCPKALATEVRQPKAVQPWRGVLLKTGGRLLKDLVLETNIDMRNQPNQAFFARPPNGLIASSTDGYSLDNVSTFAFNVYVTVNKGNQ
ncbi:hypothetical protein DdX_20273 [Ditylenchus destructor]|uniref:Uncharacterized protein n=1 Tax=Ditylenchus destructor TaxID=166010 RepID=A0AAD4MGW6_9BILA|nr:hypothetical protein DdX_20273 [Ditylenchus destructor]